MNSSLNRHKKFAEGCTSTINCVETLNMGTDTFSQLLSIQKMWQGVFVIANLSMGRRIRVGNNPGLQLVLGGLQRIRFRLRLMGLASKL